MSEAKIVIGAVDNASKVLAQVRSSMNDVTGSAEKLSRVLGTFGVAFSAGAATMWVRNIVNGIDAMNDLSDATGASVENISALEDVALRTGTSMDTVSTALVKFNQLLNTASPGSDAEAQLKAIGLSAKELKELDPAEALLKTAQALDKFANDGKKGQLYLDLFSKSTRELAPFLKDLAEKGELVAKVTKEQADEAERFNKELFNLQKNSLDAARALTGDLVVGINKAAKAMRESGLLAGIQTLLTGDDEFKNNKQIVQLTDQLLTAENALSGFRAQGFADGSKVIQNAKAQVAAIKEQIKVTQSYAKVLDEANAKPSEVKKPSAKVTGKKENGPDPDADFKRYIEQLDKEIEKSLELTKVEQLLADINTKRLTVSGKQQEELMWRAQLADSMKAEADARKLADKAMEDASKSSSKYLEDLAKEQQAQEKSNGTLRQQVEEIGLTKDQLNTLTLRRLDDAIATQEQTRAQLDLQNSSEAEIAAMEEKIKLLKEQRSLTASGQVAQVAADAKTEQDKASKEFADTLHNDLKGAFSAAFRDTSGEPLQAFGDAIANVIYSRAATALADSLMGAAGGTGGGSFLSSLFSFDGGGYTGGGSRAGGLDGKGGFMAMLHPQETVLDHTKGQSGGGQAVTVVQNFTVGDVASVSMVQKAVAGSERRIAGALSRSMQYGGALA